MVTQAHTRSSKQSNGPTSDKDASWLDQYPVEVLEMVLAILKAQAEHKPPSRSNAITN